MDSAQPPSTTMIPGLPNDIAMLCLLKVPRIYHACLASVCIAWRNAVCCPEFYQERRRLGSTDAWLVIVSVEVLCTPSLLYSAYDLSTRQLLFKIRFPPTLHVDGHNLDYYRIVAMNEYFAVLGFTQRGRMHAAICTFIIYNTVTDKWRHVRPLSICREMFACGVIEGRLYVVGGCNERGQTERTMEVYDFEADEWGTVGELPEGFGRVQGDVVYQGKLYVQCSEAGEEGRCVLWVYNPKEGKWEELRGRQMGGQGLIATDNCMYAMGGQGELFKYEASSGEWKTVERRQTAKLTATTRADKVRQRQVRSVNIHSSQRAFGHGDNIYVLQEANGGVPCCLAGDAVTKCHRLRAVKPSWYHAGAVVQA